jgi:hypothetical protein
VTTILFTPSNTASPPFQVPVTLDGVGYSLATMWSFYRGDWYVSLSDQNGNIVVNQPLIGSPANASIFLFPGFFMTSTVLYRVSTGQFEIGP